MTQKPVLVLVEPQQDSAESAIFLAIAMERERCAKIADDYAAYCKHRSAVSSMADEPWGVGAALAIAKTIRGVDG